MLNGFDENGDLKNIKVTEDGAVMVKVKGGGGQGGTDQVEVINTFQNPVPVNVMNTQEVETTLNASVQTVGTTASTVSINKKVTTIDVANYSETANVTITIGSLVAVIGCGIATTLTINANVTNISLQSTEADTKVQIVVKGVN